MAHLNQKLYDYRRESAVARNVTNEEIAVQNGMSEEQAELISKLCAIRHEFHCNMDSLTKSSEDHSTFDEIENIEDAINESGLPQLNVASMLLDIDNMNGLIYEYGDDVPENHDSQEFQDWYDDNYSRIHGELEGVNKAIEDYLRVIDKDYHTSFAPTGKLRF
nr:MAG TPA_asm: Cpf1/RNA Complex FUNCTION-RNA complex.49A [Caudoviricetes sp.]